MLTAPKAPAPLWLWKGCAKPEHPGGICSHAAPSTLPCGCPQCLLCRGLAARALVLFQTPN